MENIKIKMSICAKCGKTIILLSKKMFEGTEPMKGVELQALIKTINKLKSNKPTSLL